MVNAIVYIPIYSIQNIIIIWIKQIMMHLHANVAYAYVIQHTPFGPFQ